MFNSTVAHVSAGVHPSTTSNVLQLIHELQGTRNVPLTASIAALIALVVYYFFGRRWTAGKTESSDNIPVLRGTPILGNWRFFSDRYEFIKEGTRKFGSAFQFRILNHKVVVLSGEQARKDFLTSNSLDLSAAYRVLFGAAPDVRDIDTTAGDNLDDVMFGKRIALLLRKDRLTALLPQLLRDTENRAKEWGNSGQFDALQEFYHVVFILTARTVACDELASSPTMLSKLIGLFQMAERTTGATSVLLPWIPSRDRRDKNSAIRGMFQLFAGVLTKRREEARQGIDTSSEGPRDAMRMLMEDGNSDMDIIQFIMNALFAGIINSGVMSAWLLLYLSVHPEWKAKVIEEIQSLLTKYTQTSDDTDPDNSSCASTPLASRLSKIPPSAWENEMPITEVCLSETIRLVQSTVMLRLNVSNRPSMISGHHIQPGTFLVYSTEDVNHNPAIYPDPEKWDPTRFSREEDRSQTHAFLGWGGGRHPCLGMRFAKLEIKAIVAMFLTGYDYDAVDKSGVKMSKLPVPNRSNVFDRTRGPGGQTIYIKYNKKE